nr:AraC family ligand binding domain-containing protein [Brucella intermedia]
MQKSELLRARATARQFSPHLHSTYSVVALKRGTAEIKSARWCGIARAGDVFFFNPYEIHSARCSQEDAEYHTLYPSAEFLATCLSAGGVDERLIIETAILERGSLAGELVDALFASRVEDRRGGSGKLNI